MSSALAVCVSVSVYVRVCVSIRVCKSGLKLMLKNNTETCHVMLETFDRTQKTELHMDSQLLICSTQQPSVNFDMQ